MDDTVEIGMRNLRYACALRSSLRFGSWVFTYLLIYIPKLLLYILRFPCLFLFTM